MKKEGVVMAKTLTPAEKKKREEIAKAIERDNPGMDMSRKMAIATATAKKTTEGLFFGKKGPRLISRFSTQSRLDKAKKKNLKIKNKMDLIKTKQDIKKNKASLKALKKGKTITSSVEEDMPGNAVGQGGVNMAPNAGPRIKSINVTDRRRRKDKNPVLLKRFRSHMEEN
jgi:hypothetical protein